MDRYEGDLLLTKHSAGSITSAAIMKRWNRKNEVLATAAEAAAVTAMIEAGTDYPHDKIKSAWYRIISSQMHDILPGTSTPTVYEYSQNDEVIAMNIWNSVLEDAAKAIAPKVEGDGEILLFNPIGEHREEYVKIKLHSWNDKYNRDTDILAADILDAYNQVIPAQINLCKDENKLSGKMRKRFLRMI